MGDMVTWHTNMDGSVRIERGCGKLENHRPWLLWKLRDKVSHHGKVEG
jgi:hypothetical protein